VKKRYVLEGRRRPTDFLEAEGDVRKEGLAHGTKSNQIREDNWEKNSKDRGRGDVALLVVWSLRKKKKQEGISVIFNRKLL